MKIDVNFEQTLVTDIKHDTLNARGVGCRFIIGSYYPVSKSQRKYFMHELVYASFLHCFSSTRHSNILSIGLVHPEPACYKLNSISKVFIILEQDEVTKAARIILILLLKT